MAVLVMSVLWVVNNCTIARLAKLLESIMGEKDNKVRWWALYEDNNTNLEMLANERSL